MTIEAKKAPGGQRFYKWSEREIDLGRIIGGFSPPGEQAGFLTVVAEEYAWRPRPDGQPIHAHLIAEYTNQDLSRLIQRATEFMTKYCVADFYGNTRNESLLQYIVNFNQRARALRSKPFRLLEAPFVEGPLSYHLQILRDRLSPTEKSLHLSRESNLPSILLEFPSDDILKVNETKSPALAALSYAVATLTVRPPQYVKDKPQRYVELSEFMKKLYGIKA